jgi:putative membrane protein
MTQDTQPEQPIIEAEFSKKLILYWNIQTSLVFALTIIGIPIGIIWFFFIGPILHAKAFERLACQLYPRKLVIRRGIWFRVEKTIPLSKIQDLTFRDGPILRALGLCNISVETAGQSAAPGTSDADLTGIIDAQKFKERVLSERDNIDYNPSIKNDSAALADSQYTASLDGLETRQILAEIRDSLKRIEKRLPVTLQDKETD